MSHIQKDPLLALNNLCFGINFGLTILSFLPINCYTVLTFLHFTFYLDTYTSLKGKWHKSFSTSKICSACQALASPWLVLNGSAHLFRMLIVLL